MRAFLQTTRCETMDDDRADAFEQMANPIERRHQSPEGEDTERGKAVGSREGEKFWDQITEQNNDRENYRGGEPLGNLCRKRTFPDEKEAEHNQRNVYHHIRKQENVENAARI